MVIRNTLVKFYGMRVAQDAKGEKVPKYHTVQSRREKNQRPILCPLFKDARRISVFWRLM